jgi:hypothetical protein
MTYYYLSSRGGKSPQARMLRLISRSTKHDEAPSPSAVFVANSVDGDSGYDEDASPIPPPQPARVATLKGRKRRQSTPIKKSSTAQSASLLDTKIENARGRGRASMPMGKKRQHEEEEDAGDDRSEVTESEGSPYKPRVGSTKRSVQQPKTAIRLKVSGEPPEINTSALVDGSPPPSRFRGRPKRSMVDSGTPLTGMDSVPSSSVAKKRDRSLLPSGTARRSSLRGKVQNTTDLAPDRRIIKGDHSVLYDSPAGVAEKSPSRKITRSGVATIPGAAGLPEGANQSGPSRFPLVPEIHRIQAVALTQKDIDPRSLTVAGDTLPNSSSSAVPRSSQPSPSATAPTIPNLAVSPTGHPALPITAGSRTRSKVTILSRLHDPGPPVVVIKPVVCFLTSRVYTSLFEILGALRRGPKHCRSECYCVDRRSLSRRGR